MRIPLRILASSLIVVMMIGGMLLGFGGLVAAVIALFQAAWWTVLWGLLAVPAGNVIHFFGLAFAFRLGAGFSHRRIRPAIGVSTRSDGPSRPRSGADRLRPLTPTGRLGGASRSPKRTEP
jgi:hypothetical protein